MSAFRRYEEAVRRFNAAEENRKKATSPIDDFNDAVDQEFKKIIEKLSDNGLIPYNGLRIELRRPYGDEQAACPSHINIIMNPSESDKGEALAQAIVAAAQGKNIPIIYKAFSGHNVAVSEHIKEPERYPVILLEALGAYAGSQGKDEIATIINDAIARIEVSIQAMSAQAHD